MSPMKALVEALGREINRLWAEQNPPGTPPLVPLPSQGGPCGDNGSLCGETGPKAEERETPAGDDQAAQELGILGGYPAAETLPALAIYTPAGKKFENWKGGEQVCNVPEKGKIPPKPRERIEKRI